MLRSRKIVIALLCLFPLFTLNARGLLGSLKITNMLEIPIDVTLTFLSTQGQQHDIVQPNHSISAPWLTPVTTGRRLKTFTVKAVNPSFPSEISGKINVKNEGVYAVGKLYDLSTKNILGFDYSIHGSAKVFGGSESVNLTFNKTEFVGPFRDSCKNIKQEKTELRAECSEGGPPWHYIDGWNCHDHLSYQAILKGTDLLAQAVAHKEGPFVITNRPIYKGNWLEKTFLGVGNKGKGLPPGTYLHNTTMAYFDKKNNILLAECINSKRTIANDLCVSQANISSLDLTGKTCSDIICDNKMQLTCKQA